MSLPQLLVIGPLVALCIVTKANAHIGGASLEARDGEYLVDIGYNAITLAPNQETIFNFTLIQNPGSLDWDYVPYTSVKVVMKEPESVFEKDLPVEPPLTSFLVYTFPEAGEYAFTTIFNDANGELARATFPLTLKSPGAFTLQAAKAIPIAAMIVSTIVTLLVLIIGYKRGLFRS